MKSLARSYLFVPAARPDRVDKALATHADAVIVDLEDGVAGTEKDRARAALGAWTSPRPFLVRVNGSDTPIFRDDIAAIAELTAIAGVVLPKVEGAAQIDVLRRLVDVNVGIYALVESAAGILNAAEVAHAGVERMLFGSADYLASLGASPSREVFALPRSMLAVASAAAGIAPPVDGPTLAFDDEQATETDAIDAKALGFGGKLCIHPRQLDVVNRVFGPTTEELAWARRLVEHAEIAGEGASALDGTMVDVAVLNRARRLLGLS